MTFHSGVLCIGPDNVRNYTIARLLLSVNATPDRGEVSSSEGCGRITKGDKKKEAMIVRKQGKIKKRVQRKHVYGWEWPRRKDIKGAEECEAEYECEYTSMAVVMVGKILEPVAMPTRVRQHLVYLSMEGLKVMGDFWEKQNLLRGNKCIFSLSSQWL